MKKNLLKWVCLMVLGAMMVVSCEKPNPEEEPATLVGTWNDDGGSWMRIDMYELDGTLIESIPWETLGTTFTFNEDGTVEAPWGYSYNYTLEGDTLRLKHEDWKDRVYTIISRTDDHLVMEFPNACDYTMGDSIPVIGVEYEHWSLRKQQ